MPVFSTSINQCILFKDVCVNLICHDSTIINQVQYVDYGAMETIPVVHVYPTLLCDDVPQLCLPCQLHGIIPVRA